MLAVPVLPSGGIFFIRAIDLVAWCIVPSTRKSRGPKNARKNARPARPYRFAYDWRASIFRLFETEIDTCRKHNIEITGLVVPNQARQRRANNSALLNAKTEADLWVMGGGEPTKSPEEQQSESKRKLRACVRSWMRAAMVAKLACISWRVVRRTGESTRDHQSSQRPKRRMVYIFITRTINSIVSRKSWRKLNRTFIASTSNGMVSHGERTGKKILTVGAGDENWPC